MRAALGKIGAVISALLVRLACRLVAGALFRVRVMGRENVPTRGPALLVANHLTHLDGFLIGACLRPAVRFLVWRPYYDHVALNCGFRIARAIPVWTGHRSVMEAVTEARRALAAGDVLCIFAEGSISRNGELQPFQRGFERVVAGLDTPIIPVHLGELWESIFSYAGGRFLGKWPRRWRHPAVISFGRPMRPWSKAAEVRGAVRELAKERVR